MPADQVTRAVFRATLRAACKLDTRPALQALIHRNRARNLPEDFNSVLSVFLGGHHRHFYVPSLLPGPTIAQTVRDAFRFPPGPPNMDAGLMGMRFLHGILHTAERHGLTPDRNPAASPREASIRAVGHQSSSQVSLRAVPEQGCILVSHPLLRDSHSNYFYQTVVMLCRHSFASGTYGLILNRILSNEAKARVHDMIQGLDSSHGHAASSAGVDLALDMPLAMQAMLDDWLQKGAPSYFDTQRAGYDTRSSDDFSDASDEDEDVSFLPEDPAETSIDVSFVSSIPASAAETPSDDSDARATPPAQAAVQQPGVTSTVGRHDEKGNSTGVSGPVTPGADQKREAKRWQATIKRPASAAAPGKPAAHASAAPSDIADPKHPLRFHQFLTNMKRSPASPLSADLQDSPEPVSSPETDSQAALSSQQPLQTPVRPTHRSQSASPDNFAEASHVAAASSQEQTDIPAASMRSSDNDSEGPSSKPGSSTSQGGGTRVGSLSGTEPGLMDLVPFDVMSRTLSRGGPVPGGQVLHSSPELGGDAVQEPSEGAPGIYVGCDKGRAQELLNSGQLSDVTMRFFVGEAQWGSQQLETELAQGSWLLLSPSPQLLHDMSLKPHSFTDWGEGSDTDVDQQLLREQMWKEVMARAGKPFADLINIPTQLVKGLMDIKY